MTGENKEDGVTPRIPVFVNGGWGAVELVARYDTMEFGSRTASGTPSRSPRAANVLRNADRSWTVGVNWYANSLVRIRLNGIRETIEDPQRAPVPGKNRFYTVVAQFQLQVH
jgi:phosphate-selective porin